MIEITRSEDGSIVTVTMTVGEAIALRDQLGRLAVKDTRSDELRKGLDSVIPARLVVLTGKRKGKRC